MGFFEQAALVCSSQTVQDHHKTQCTINAVKWIENCLEGLKRKPQEICQKLKHMQAQWLWSE